MFVTWLLSLLLSIPEVAVTFTHASGKRSNPWIQGHVAVILQKNVESNLLFILQHKSFDVDIENKLHETTYRVLKLFWSRQKRQSASASTH